jgi:hypothetical protein
MTNRKNHVPRPAVDKPGGGPTQCRGDQRSGSGGDGAVFSLIIFYVRGDQRSGGGGDGAAARKKYRVNATAAFCSSGANWDGGRQGGEAL